MDWETPYGENQLLTPQDLDTLQWALNFMQKYERAHKVRRLIEKELVDE